MSAPVTCECGWRGHPVPALKRGPKCPSCNRPLRGRPRIEVLVPLEQLTRGGKSPEFPSALDGIRADIERQLAGTLLDLTTKSSLLDLTTRSSPVASELTLEDVRKGLSGLGYDLPAPLPEPTVRDFEFVEGKLRLRNGSTVALTPPPPRDLVAEVRALVARFSFGGALALLKLEVSVLECVVPGCLHLHSEALVPERESGEPIRVAWDDHLFVGELAPPALEQLVRHRLARGLRRFWDHEFDEGLRWDGKLVHDPHAPRPVELVVHSRRGMLGG